MSDTTTRTRLPLVTVPNVVLPGATVTLHLGDTRVRAAVEAARREAGGLLAIRPGTPAEGLAGGTADGAAEVGVIAAVPDVGTLPGGDPAAIL
ncbi:MAG TPA: endopeptidase La, partial [Acidimicrobiaceae bacterium]|nr:endopeptidase La [Acidimicrobiaceae bacterium]